MTVSDTPGDRRRKRPVIVSFISASSYSGRTSIVANLAWLIASSGADVLVMDWAFDGTPVHDYLKPFQVDEGSATDFLSTELARGLADAMAVGAEPGSTGGDPRLRRYLGAGVKSETKLDVIEQRARPAAADDDVGAFVRLRELLADAEYDYVLVDGPPPRREAPAIRD